VLFRSTRQHLTADINISEADARKFFNNNLFRYTSAVEDQSTFEEFAPNARHDAFIENRQKILSEKVKSLKEKYPIKINTSLLDSILVNDFKKSRWANLMLFKASSGRQAVPIVDPTWSF